MSNEYNQIPNPAPQQSPDVQNAVTEALNAEKKKKKKKRLIIFAVILAVIVIIGVAGASGGDKDAETSKATVTAAADSGKSADSAVEAENDADNASDSAIGSYECVVKEAKICKNWEGKDSVKITYTFTNNSSDAASFDIALSDEVYQDGIQLESTFISSDDDDWGIDVKIKPGMSKDVSKVYILRDTKTDLDVEISELISFSDDKLVTTVKLKK
ncbi:MAG: DUF5067 domain-containing protein [Eubacterium sp.]|nr:DUF5067 domain-containing protein [Eubacterium sp.]